MVVPVKKVLSTCLSSRAMLFSSRSWVSLKMEGYMDDAASVRAFGIEVVARLCERLIAGGAPGLHFYTLNQSGLSLEICRRLGALPA